jgi:hypothetical protein
LFNTAHPKRFRADIWLHALRIDRLVLGALSRNATIFQIPVCAVLFVLQRPLDFSGLAKDEPSRIFYDA